MTQIIGNGMLATAFKTGFKPKAGLLVFASGVSNSQENRPEAFAREAALLSEALKAQKFTLYFSSCSLEDPSLSSPYVAHKKAMEALVQSSRNYAIFRLPQLVGKTENPNTLTNYLYQHINSGTHFEVWRHAQRNLIDVEDAVTIIEYLYSQELSKLKGAITNIASPFSISVKELIPIFEKILNKKADFSLTEAGGSYTINADLSLESSKKIGISFDEFYIEKLIRKYYAVGAPLQRNNSCPANYL